MTELKKESKLFRATLKNGMPIVTVIAIGVKDAHRKAYDEMSKNPLRLAIREKWLRDGAIIKERDCPVVGLSRRAK